MAKRYWESISEDHLLAVDLTTDDPEKLEIFTLTVPDGPDGSFVEYGYNLRGLEREKIRCAHCHQLQLAGVVVNKGGLRFPVGHICGAHIYGVDFAALKKDYDTAVIRQDTLRRVREIRAVVDPFLEWMEQFSNSPAFHLRDELLLQLRKRMPWLWEQLQWHTNNTGGYLNGLKLPDTLFDGFTDPQRGFKEAAADISRSAMLVVGKIEIDKDVGGTLSRLQLLIGQVEKW